MSYEYLIQILKGSSRSGNYGHAGIPGHHGGSSPGGGLTSAGKPKPKLGRRNAVGKPQKEKPETSKPETSKLTESTNPDSWYDRISDKERDVVDSYQGKAYLDINSQLRSGKLTGKTKKLVEVLDSALSKSKLTKETTLHAGGELYRAADIPEITAALKSKKSLTGIEFKDKGFISTTTDKAIADNFDRSENSRLFIINAPKGTKAGKIPSSESEVLLARNTGFKVGKVEKRKEKQQYRDFKGKIKTRTVNVEYIHLDITGQD